MYCCVTNTKDEYRNTKTFDRQSQRKLAKNRVDIRLIRAASSRGQLWAEEMCYNSSSENTKTRNKKAYATVTKLVIAEYSVHYNINPLKGSGFRRLHFKVFSAIQV